MTTTSAADKRKMRRLEEDLEESDKQKKIFERKVATLTKDLQELTEKYDATQKAGATSEWSAKKTTEILDNKSLERTQKTLEDEIERLKKELKEQKDKVAQIQKDNREQNRTDVDKSFSAREYQNQYEETKRILENEREHHKEELIKQREEYEKKAELDKRQKRRTGNELKVKDFKNSSQVNSAFASLSKSIGNSDATQDMAVELKEIRRQLEEEQEKSEKQKKKYDKEASEFQEKIKDLTLLKERSEKKYLKFEEEAKKLNVDLEKEKKAKFDLEKEKYQLSREVRDTQKLVKDLTEEKGRQREEMLKLEQKTSQAVANSKDASSIAARHERELTSFKKLADEEVERAKQLYERKISQLEREIEEWKNRTNKTETNESTLVIDNRRITAELDKVKNQLDAQAGDFEREKTRYERQINNLNKQYQDEMEKMKEDMKKAEERRKKEAKFLEDLENKTEEAIAQRKATVAQTLEKVKAETDSLKQIEMERERKAATDSNGGKWKEMLEFKEKQFEEELNELRQKLKEKEKTGSKDKEKFIEENKEKEKEWISERKKFQEREKKRNAEFEELNVELINEKHAKQILEDQTRKLTDDLRAKEFELEDEREERKIDSDRTSARIKALQEEITDLQNDNHELATELRKVENLLRDKEDECRTVKRDLEDSVLILDETKSSLAKVQVQLEKLQLESKAQIESLEQKLVLIQKEANEERQEKEKQIKLRIEIEKRLAEVEFYFFPLGEQVKQTDFGTPAFKLIQRKKKELGLELEEIKKRHLKKSDGIDSLHQRLVEALRNIPESNKEVTAYQLQGLMQALEAADFPIRQRLYISVALVEGLVDPEIIREVRLLTELMVESSVHFLDTPESVIRLAVRDVEEQKTRPDYDKVKRSETMTLRDALLSRLSKLRSRRMRKPKDEVKEGILQEIYTKADG